MVARSSNPEREREFESLQTVALTLIDFYESLEDESESSASGWSAFREAIEAAAAKKHLAGMRMAKNDLLAMLETVPGRQRAPLDSMLRQRTGLTLEDLLARQLAQIKKIQQRGKITTETQYYLVREYLESIWSDSTKSGQFKSLEELMNAYEERAAQRQGRGPE